MLGELSHLENLGTPRFFWEISSLVLRNPGKWKEKDIKKYFSNKIIDGEFIFDGCLLFAIALGVIEEKDGCLYLAPLFYDSLINENFFKNKILERLFILLKKDDVFYEIFCSENISYDIIHHCIQIENSAFQFKYSNFKKFLVNFNFLFFHPDTKIDKLIISQKYKKFFDNFVLPEIKKRKFGIDKLRESIEKKQIYGEEAEEFSFNFEKNRLAGHDNIKDIKIISKYDVAAGYDIISYNDNTSKQLDRYIEVKSFSGLPNFHWSSNEIDVSRIKKDNYFLYLVDREKINQKGYVPLIINNPYKKILNSKKWIKEVESYYLTYEGTEGKEA